MVMTSASVRALVSSFTTWEYDKWKDGGTSSRYPNPRGVKTHSPEQTDEYYDVCAAVVAGFTVQRRVCAEHKAVTGGSMSSLRHLMMRGGVQIL